MAFGEAGDQPQDGQDRPQGQDLLGDRRQVEREPRDAFATAGHDWGKDRWHRLRLVRETGSGKIAVYVNDMAKPIMTATDTTHGAGLLGVGSFDDTGLFDRIRVWAPRVEKRKAAFFTAGKTAPK